MKKLIHKTMEGLRKYRVRVMLSLVFSMFLFVTPALTQAKYKWTLNGSSIIQAKSFYFTSNLLKSEGDGYGETTGWNGKSSPIGTIEIHNYENTLLANNEGEDVNYKLSWTIRTFDEDGTEKTGNDAYTIEKVTVKNSDNVTSTIYNAETDDTEITSYTSTITGDGTTKQDNYEIVVKVPSSYTATTIPENGSYILVTVNAKTVSSTGSFDQELKGQFKYIVSTQEGFIKQFSVEETDKTKDMLLTIGTDVIPSYEGQSQAVTVWWDAECIDVNMLNSTFVQMMEAGRFNEVEQTIDDKTYHYCTLQITDLNSNSYRTLSLYKKTYKRNGTTYNRTAEWFNLATTATLLGKLKDPIAGINTGAILGYYFENQQ